ncbi:hypothetical protein KEM55_001838 [Ascosphaera atra]|nr:hypothetical protein KEM55_001838 [Ascosphaera atra]
MMAHAQFTSQSVLRCLRQSYRAGLPFAQSRALSGTSAAAAEGTTDTTTTKPQAEAEAEAPKQAFYKNPDPNLVTSPRLERRLMRAGTFPVGSRRRRAALQNSPNIPFEQLPYQCFQEARKIIIADREEKLKQIQAERAKLERLRATPAEKAGGEKIKKDRIDGMLRHLEKLKILADINDPVVKRRFEDGLGDMGRPIYRFLADKKWREYRREVLMQRVTQMNVAPDVVPEIDPTVDVKLSFGKHPVQPGNFVNSAVSEAAPRLSIQSFTQGQKLVTIAVVDPDVPNVSTDSFESRWHFLAINVPVTPTSPVVDLAALSEEQVIIPWAPPYAQKGQPYHRLTTVVLDQRSLEPILKRRVDKFIKNYSFVRGLESMYKMLPVGVHLFRSIWDENTAEVMNKHGIPGADIEFKRKKAEALPYKRRDTSRMRG